MEPKKYLPSISILLIITLLLVSCSKTPQPDIAPTKVNESYLNDNQLLTMEEVIQGLMSQEQLKAEYDDESRTLCIINSSCHMEIASFNDNILEGGVYLSSLIKESIKEGILVKFYCVDDLDNPFLVAMNGEILERPINTTEEIARGLADQPQLEYIRIIGRTLFFDGAEVVIKEFSLTKDVVDQDVLKIVYSYTNTSSDTVSPYKLIDFSGSQSDGPVGKMIASDHVDFGPAQEDLPPGATVENCEQGVLADLSEPLKLSLSGMEDGMNKTYVISVDLQAFK